MPRFALPVVALLVLGCGSRSGLLSEEPREVAPTLDAGLLDASVPPDAFVALDADFPLDANVELPDSGERELERAVQVSAGLFHTCAVTELGRVHCWGFNNHGQLGDGSGEIQRQPVPSPVVGDALKVVAGPDHTCALRRDRTLLCWGSNLAGQAGTGEVVTRHVLPEPVVELTRIQEVTAGGEHTCALVDDGRLFCWGSNDNGQVGPDTAGSYRRPIEVPLPSPVTRVAAGFEHTCALLEDRRVLCWGEAAIDGRLRRDDEIAPPFVASVVPGLPARVDELSSGDFESCARSGGEVFCWGFELTGDPFDFDAVVRARPAERVPGLDDAVAISAGHEFACALREDRSVACWGENDRGQLGNGGGPPFEGVLVEPTGLPPSRMVTSGWRHACALDVAGVVRCWGRGTEGQIGDGMSGEYRLPTVAAVFRD